MLNSCLTNFTENFRNLTAIVEDCFKNIKMNQLMINSLIYNTSLNRGEVNVQINNNYLEASRKNDLMNQRNYINELLNTVRFNSSDTSSTEEFSSVGTFGKKLFENSEMNLELTNYLEEIRRNSRISDC
jgi:hypothetical protein